MKRISLSCLAAAAACAVALTPTAMGAGKSYVAFGDSFASGPGLAVRDASCDRSTENYPSKIANTLQLGAESSGDWIDYSCSGATTGWGRVNQDPSNLWGGLTGQLSWAAGHGTLGGDTDLVTISIGGNDVWKTSNPNFGSLYKMLEQCGQAWWDCSTSASHLQTSDITAAKYRSWVETQITQINTAAPNAKILITSYPGIVPRAGQAGCNGIVPGTWVVGWSFGQSSDQAEASYLHGLLAQSFIAQHGAAQLIEQAIDDARPLGSTKPDAIVRVVNQWAPSNTHDMCAGSNAWYGRPDASASGTRLHPLAAGMQSAATQTIAKYNTSF